MDAVNTPIGPLPHLDAVKVLAYCESFCRDGDERYLWFAAHCAFPAALTTDLAYKIWLNFRHDDGESPMNIPLVAVSDLLLSPLYRPTGHGLFETTQVIREAILRYLAKHPRFGPQRLDHLAHFLKYYVRDNPGHIPSPAFRQAQEFVYLAHLEPLLAAERLLEAWNQNDRSRFRHLLAWSEQETRLAEKQSGQGPANALGVAVQLVKGIQYFQGGEKDKAIELLTNLKGLASRAKAEGISVNIPQAVLDELPGGMFGNESGEIEVKNVTPSHYAKIHLLTPSNANQADIAEKLFGVNIKGLHSEPLLCYQWDTSVVVNEINREQEWRFQVWQFSDNTPEILDRFLLTDFGLYIVWISETETDAQAYLKNWQNRLMGQIGKNNVWVILPEDFDVSAIKDCNNWLASVMDVKELLIDWMVWWGAGFYKNVESQVISPENELRLVKGQFIDGAPEYIYHKTNDRLSLLNSVGLIRWFKASEPLPNIAFTGPASWAEKLRLLYKSALQNEGVLSIKKSGLEDDIERQMVAHCLSAIPSNTQDFLFIPAAFPQKISDYFFDYRIRPTTYFLLTFDFLPSDFRNRLTQKLLADEAATLLANRLPVVLGMEGYVVQINVMPENIMQILITAPWPQPAFEFKKSKSAVIQKNWGAIRRSKKSQFAISAVPGKLTQTIDACRSQYPYEISYTPKTLHIPAYATPDMVFVKGGTFQMGDVMGDKEHEDELPLHEVTLDNFKMGRFAVTFEEYDAYCEATGKEKPDDEGWGRERRPVINVNWFDAIEYCNWLSEIWGLEKFYTINKKEVTVNDWKAIGYRLPTEAEWEYAAREGGRKVRFGNGKDLADPKEINFDASKEYKKPYSVVGEYSGKTVAVGSLNSPSALGLHDMSGNVWEWCNDLYGGYVEKEQVDPKGSLRGSRRVYRGGSWFDYPRYCRVADRGSDLSGRRGTGLGFRLVLPSS